MNVFMSGPTSRLAVFLLAAGAPLPRAAIPPGRTCADCVRFDACRVYAGAMADDVLCAFARPQFEPRGVDYARITREVCR